MANELSDAECICPRCGKPMERGYIDAGKGPMRWAVRLQNKTLYGERLAGPERSRWDPHYVRSAARCAACRVGRFAYDADAPWSITSWMRTMHPLTILTALVMSAATFVTVSLIRGQTSASSGQPATFVQPEGRFSVAMPGQPIARTKSLSASGVPLTSTYYVVTGSDACVYTVGFIDYPAQLDLSNASVVLQGAVDAQAHATDGAIMSGQITTHQGLPAIEFAIGLPAAAGQFRGLDVLDGNTIYDLAVVIPASHSPSLTVQHFESSFHIGS